MQINENTWWAMRRRHLPVLPAKPGYSVSVWQGAHPSPEFSKYKVWYVGYTRLLGDLFKDVYREALASLIPDSVSLLSKLAHKPTSLGGTVTLNLSTSPKPPAQLKRWKRWRRNRR